MPSYVVAAILLAASVANAQVGTDSSEAVVRQRADSIAHLDPDRELRRALAAGDRRCIALQGYSVMPAFAPMDSLTKVWRVLCAEGMHVVPGTSDVLTPAVAQLSRVAFDYGVRYNRALLAVLRREHALQDSLRRASPRKSRSRPAT